MFERYPVLRQVIVNTKTDRAFRGVLWRRRRSGLWPGTGGYLVLRQAELLRAKGEVTPMDGELVIPEENVDFLQVVG